MAHEPREFEYIILSFPFLYSTRKSTDEQLSMSIDTVKYTKHKWITEKPIIEYLKLTFITEQFVSGHMEPMAKIPGHLK